MIVAFTMTIAFKLDDDIYPKMAKFYVILSPNAKIFYDVCPKRLRAHMLHRVGRPICYGNSVRPSVRPSDYEWIVLKRLNISHGFLAIGRLL